MELGEMKMFNIAVTWIGAYPEIVDRGRVIQSEHVRMFSEDSDVKNFIHELYSNKSNSQIKLWKLVEELPYNEQISEIVVE
ncbi:MAG: hypothetical protein WC998_00825 [Candidatus Paceibacterota bacterium]|jgi:hypothetical protein